MMRFMKGNKFLIFGLFLLLVLSVIDMNYTYRALDNTWNSLLSMLIIVPPIFILIGLFDVWVPRETIIHLLGEESGMKGMALAFFLGAFSAGPTIAAFPLAMVMLKKGAKYSNVLFFLMVWSSLKLPIVFFQITTLGFKFSMIINITMLIIFIITALISPLFFTKDELKVMEQKAEQYTK